MKKVNLKLIILVVIIFIAAIFRFYQLGANPASMTWDEVAYGYNAYSIGIDGKDEFGKFLPHDYLESFGDFKPPMYSYLDVIPIKLFGLNEFAVRFPSALFGLLTVLLTYFLVKRIFWKSNQKENYALLSAFILAISPWHIMLSRAAFEANIATFFIVLGVLSFFAAVYEKKWYLLISALSFVLSMYTFNTARIVSPLLVLTLAIGFRQELFNIKKTVIIAGLLGLIIFLPVLGFLLSPKAGVRFQEVNIFSDISILQTSNQQIINDHNNFLSKIIHNRRFVYSLEYLKHYFDNLRPQFLFISGDENPKFSTQATGQMYLWDLPFFVAGCFLLFKKREKNWWFIPLWLLIGIIPSAVARETPHALRIEATLPTFQIIVAFGFIELLNLLNKYKKQFLIIAFLLLTFNFIYFLHDYYFHYNNRFAGVWQYGYKESVEYVSKVQDNYDYVQIRDFLGRPYIYYLFYTKTSPDYFRNNSKITRDSYGFVDVKSFGKYIFVRDSDYTLSETKKVLYIDSFDNIPSKAHVLKTFNTFGGEPEMVAYTI